jgi:DNA-binding ferritin-like protein
MEEIEKENAAEKGKLNDAIEEMQSQQDEIFELLRTVNEKKIELIKNAIRLEKAIERSKQISPSVPTHIVDEYNETIERCCQSIEQAREFVWEINKGIGTISMNDEDEALWVQVPTSSD